MAKTSAARLPSRDRLGTSPEVPAFTATEAKNSFGALMAAAARYGAVAVTKREVPEAVLLSITEYENLVSRIPDPLESLRSEFDALVERIQTPNARKATDALFAASGAELGEAAARSARAPRRG